MKLLNIKYNIRQCFVVSVSVLSISSISFCVHAQLPSGIYTIKSKFSGLVMDVENSSTSSGANIQQWASNGEAQQQWEVADLGTGYYSIIASHSGRGMSIPTFNSRDGADITQRFYYGSQSQQWAITNQGSGYYSIVNRYSSKAAEVYGWSSSNGGNIAQWEFTNGDNQLWAFVAPGTGGDDGGGNGGGGDGGNNGGGGGNDPVGTANRPLLTTAQADNYTVLKYLQKAGNLSAGLSTDNWNPTSGIGDVNSFSARYTVASSGGTHRSVQSAISAAVALGGSSRIYIRVAAGTYREVVCVPSSAPPITLYSTSTNASQTVIVYNNYSGKSKSLGSAANACNPNSSSSTYGTTGSASITIKANNFQAKNITFSNDVNESSIPNNGTQGVAVLTEGDKIVFENMRFLGNQDTFYAKTGNDDLVKRVYVKNSYVEGDVDYIFGNTTMVFDSCTIHYLTARQGSNGGMLFAPSTDARHAYGILAINSNLTAAGGTPQGVIHLGRAWDAGIGSLNDYRSAVASGVYPNGQVVVRNSNLGAHIRRADPWRASTSSRPYSSTSNTYPANRFYEFQNTGAGSL